jgi:hypothetical protein
MEFLLSHWHCILPAAGIAVALLFMRGKPADKKSPPADRRNPTDTRFIQTMRETK